ncbi:MAG: alpha/beta hydrolase [Xanthobacteraceae bacterium]
MIAAGSHVPNLIDARELAQTHGTRLRRHSVVAPALLLVLCAALLQACGNSDPKPVAEAGSSSQASIATKGDSIVASGETVVPRVARPRSAGDVVAPAGRRDSFSDRFAPVTVQTAAAPPREVQAAAASPREAQAAAASPRERAEARPQIAAERTGSIASGSYKTAALSPQMAYAALPPVKQTQTRLIGFDNSAFPYSSRGGRYSDNRVLVHVPAGFDASKPAVMVVFFHGHRATLERDVRDRQLLPAQISESGVNAVLVAPQLAYDAADSSAGKLAERDGLKRFLAEAAEHLTRIYGDQRARDAFANMPVVIVGYSGGFVSAAASLHVGGLGPRVSGVVLLDALYGEMDKFTSWIVKNPTGFFVSAYTTHNKARDDQLAKMLRDRGIRVQYGLDGPLEPGTVAFLSLGEKAGHRDFVTRAWTKLPVADILDRMAQR